MNKILAATTGGDVDALAQINQEQPYNDTVMDLFFAAFDGIPSDDKATKEVQQQLLASFDALVASPTTDTLQMVLHDIEAIGLEQVEAGLPDKLKQVAMDYVKKVNAGKLGVGLDAPTPSTDDTTQEPTPTPSHDPYTNAETAADAFLQSIYPSIDGAVSNNLKQVLPGIIAPMFHEDGMTTQSLKKVLPFLYHKLDVGELAVNGFNAIEKGLQDQIAMANQTELPVGDTFDVPTAMKLMGIKPGDPNYDIVEKYVQKAADAQSAYDIYPVGTALKSTGKISKEQWKALLKYTQNVKGGLKNKYYQHKKGAYYGKNKPASLKIAPKAPSIQSLAPAPTTEPVTSKTPELDAASTMLSNALEYDGSGWNVSPESTEYFVAGLEKALTAATNEEAETQLSYLIDEFDVPSSVASTLQNTLHETRKKLGKESESVIDASTNNVLQSIFGDSLTSVDPNTLSLVTGYVNAAVLADSPKDSFAQVLKLQDTMQLTDAEAYNIFHYVSQERKKIKGEKPAAIDSSAHTADAQKATDNADQVLKFLTGDSSATFGWLSPKPELANALMDAMHATNHIDFLNAMQSLKATLDDPQVWGQWLKAALEVRPDIAKQIASVKGTLDIEPSAAPEPTPLEQPNAPKDKPISGTDFLDTDDDEVEDVFKALEFAKNQSGVSIANYSAEDKAKIASIVHAAIDSGSQEAAAKTLQALSTEFGLEGPYVKAIENHIVQEWGWGKDAQADAQKLAAIPLPAQKAAETNMKKFMYNFGKGQVPPEVAYQKVMKWLGDKYSSATTAEEKKFTEQTMNAMLLKFGTTLNKQMMAAPPTASVSVPSTASQLSQAEQNFEAVKNDEATKAYNTFMHELPQFQKLPMDQKKLILSSVMNGLGEMSYDEMKYNHVKPLMDKIPGFDQAAYEKLKYLLKPLMEKGGSPYAQAKSQVVAQIQAKKDAEKKAAEKAYYDLLYGKGAEYKIAPYNEPQSMEQTSHRVNHVLKNVIQDIGFGPGQLPDKERKAYLKTVASALTVPQPKVNDIIDDLFNSTSLTPNQVLAIKKAVHKERQTPASLNGGSGKSNKPPKAHDMFTPKFKLANLDDKQKEMAKAMLNMVIKSDKTSFYQAQEVAMKTLNSIGVPQATAKRWIAWAQKLKSAGAIIQPDGKMIVPFKGNSRGCGHAIEYRAFDTRPSWIDQQG
jgi:hypothetical protein